MPRTHHNLVLFFSARLYQIQDREMEMRRGGDVIVVVVAQRGFKYIGEGGDF